MEQSHIFQLTQRFLGSKIMVLIDELYLHYVTEMF